MGRTRILALLALTLAPAGAALASSGAADPRARVLVFSKTSGFRHDSIPAAVRAVRELGARNGIAVEATEDAGAFTSARLRRYDAVVFLLTTGDVLNAAQQNAFQRWFRAGGGYAGVHSASDTEYEWPWYGRLLGTRFRIHPQIQQARVQIVSPRHPSTVGLPASWSRTDEWYNFARRPAGVRVLARLDESSYVPGQGAMGADHPIAWAREFQGGRAWYTGGGHTSESYSEPLFRRHLIGGIRYAADLSPPQILSVATTVRGGRIAVRVRYKSCSPCAGELVVRSTRRSLGLRDGTGIATTGRLPSGRWPVTVVLRDRATGLADSVRRAVRVS